MQHVPNVSRVSITKSKQIVFTINEPDVFKAPTSDTYVIFGDAKIEDMQQMMQQQLAKQMMMAQKQAQGSAAGTGPSSASLEATQEDEGEVDETGLDAKDIELIMGQAGVSRAKAVRALRKTEGDLVSAIMDLTM